MICRRGGIDKHDIGAIRIFDTTTEFEISARAAESFAVKIRRPDKEDNIRIEALPTVRRASPRPKSARLRETRNGRRSRTANFARQTSDLGRKARDEKPWSNKPPGENPATASRMTTTSRREAGV